MRVLEKVYLKTWIRRTAWEVKERGELGRRKSHLSCVWVKAVLDGGCFGGGGFGGELF